ncbi:cytochrome c [Novosphingobium chloroacetimidivorans]|uniref:Cytochrome c n=1 Tax=Novosphingobium chloroacetimidivorans TaxID=1428314 RepID=A0A7W7NW19_9SPHN|nr:c-type cytochrome [Novosphingobium chloroacetimidivorans]MBB4857647.1 cytochrome c [Novosphingobium chloroacetimidivorans]
MTMRRRPVTLAAITMALALTSGCGKGEQNDAAGTPSPTQNAAATTVAPTVAPAVAAASPPPAFAVCASCHAVVPGQNRIGPSLAGVYGRKAASMPGYAYSPALKNAGIVWDDAALDRWLQGPVQMVPGTKMVIGLSDPQGRKSVIEYLKTLK